jgi:hypothetical protein
MWEVCRYPLISLAILPEAASREGLRIAKHGPRSMN